MRKIFEWFIPSMFWWKTKKSTLLNSARLDHLYNPGVGKRNGEHYLCFAVSKAAQEVKEDHPILSFFFGTNEWKLRDDIMDLLNGHSCVTSFLVERGDITWSAGVDEHQWARWKWAGKLINKYLERGE